MQECCLRIAAWQQGQEWRNCGQWTGVPRHQCICIGWRTIWGPSLPSNTGCNMNLPNTDGRTARRPAEQVMQKHRPKLKLKHWLVPMLMPKHTLKRRPWHWLKHWAPDAAGTPGARRGRPGAPGLWAPRPPCHPVPCSGLGCVLVKFIALHWFGNNCRRNRPENSGVPL